VSDLLLRADAKKMSEIDTVFGGWCIYIRTREMASNDGASRKAIKGGR